MKFKNDVYLILLSFFLAFVIWIQFQLLKEQTVIISLPVHYYNLPTEYTNSELPYKITFKVVGKGYDILKLKLSNIQAKYDVSKVSMHAPEFELKNFNIELPQSINVLFIESYDDERVKSDTYQSVFVGIELDFANNETRDLFYDMNYKLETDKIEIKGYSNLINNITSIKTESITKSLLKKHVSELNLISPSKKIELTKTTVKLFHANETKSTRLIFNVPIQHDAEFEFFPREITVRVMGNIDLLRSITKDSFNATLNLNAEKQNLIPLNVSVYDNNIEIIDFSPKSVSRKAKPDVR